MARGTLMLAQFPDLEPCKLPGIKDETLIKYGVGKVGDRLYFPCYAGSELIAARIEQPGYPIRWVEGSREFAFGLQANSSRFKMVLVFDERLAMQIHEQTEYATIAIPTLKAAQNSIRYLEQTEELIILARPSEQKKAEAVGSLFDDGFVAYGSIPEQVSDWKQVVWAAKKKYPDWMCDPSELEDELVDLLKNPLKYKGETTGWEGLDKLVGGFRDAGEMWIVAAPPGIGKSTIFRNLARNLAVNLKRHSMLVTLEDEPTRALARLTQQVLAVNILESGLEKVSEQALREASRDVQRYIHIGQLHGDVSIDNVVKLVKSAAKVYKCKTIFIDHLTALAESSGENPVWYVSSLLSKLRLLCAEYGIQILVVTHINRNGNDEKVTLYDLKHGSSIEQNADIVLLLSRQRKENKVKVSTLKAHRYWNIMGEFWLDYDPESATLSDALPPVEPEKETEVDIEGVF
jgi:KaiC/GvpD/RAD55 family RecA-like ATPase